MEEAISFACNSSVKRNFCAVWKNHNIEQFKQIMSFDEDTAMQKKWNAFVRKIDTKTDNYSTVLKTIKAFLTKPFTAAVGDKEFTEKWSAIHGEWIREKEKWNVKIY